MAAEVVGSGDVAGDDADAGKGRVGAAVVGGVRVVRVGRDVSSGIVASVVRERVPVFVRFLLRS